MGLGSRTARHHEHALMATAGVDSSARWDFQPDQSVMTVDGFRGVVVAVLDGPIAGTESYDVMLVNGMGGGQYTASQLHAISDVTGTVHRTAADDYPELGTVLEDRPDIARNTVLASRRQEQQAEMQATAAEVDEALEVPGAADLLAGNETGPTKYSSLQVEATQNLCPDHTYLHGGEPANIVAKKDCDVCKRKTSAIDHVQRYVDWAKGEGHNPDDLKTLLTYQKQPGIGRAHVDHIADQYHLEGEGWRGRAKTAADHQTVDGTDCQEGTEPSMDGNGHLTWNGHAPSADTDAYSMFGSPDVSKTGGVSQDIGWGGDRSQPCANCYHTKNEHGDRGGGCDACEAAEEDPDDDSAGAENCGGFEPGEDQSTRRSYSMLREASQDSDFRFHVTASWHDVRNKAKRIRAEGGVHITLATEGMVVAEVKGDHNVYETGLQRLPSRLAVASWSCGCKWGAYHWGASDDFSRFAGRMCSHALALHYEAQSRGMFGRPIGSDDSKPSWAPRKVVVKYDIDERRNVRGPATTVPADYARIASLSPIALLMITSARDHTLAATAVAMETLGFTEQYVSPPLLGHLAAVNNAWGEPTPNATAPLPGPTMPPDKGANPASTGWASSPDPTSWDQAIPQDNVGHMVAAKNPVAGLAYLDCPDCGETTRSRDAGGVYPTCINCAAALPDLKDREEFGPAVAHSKNAGHDPGTFIAADTVGDTGAEADLHDEPEPALPATDGSFDGDAEPYGEAGDQTSPESLEPEDESFVSTGSLDDVVAQFQATAGAQALQGSGANDSSEIAQMAMATLQGLEAKTAVKDFTPGEQAAIINEGETLRAANSDRLNLTGTHYENLEAAMRKVEDEEDDGGWLS